MCSICFPSFCCLKYSCTYVSIERFLFNILKRGYKKTEIQLCKTGGTVFSYARIEKEYLVVNMISTCYIKHTFYRDDNKAQQAMLKDVSEYSHKRPGALKRPVGMYMY